MNLLNMKLYIKYRIFFSPGLYLTACRFLLIIFNHTDSLQKILDEIKKGK